MAVHVFGNTPSPAVSTYGLHKTVEHSDADVKDFVDNNFYVDDGLVSCTSAKTAIDLVQRTKQILHDNGRLRPEIFKFFQRKKPRFPFLFECVWEWIIPFNSGCRRKHLAQEQLVSD
jgi:hypothetical protein